MNTKWETELEQLAGIISQVPELTRTTKWGSDVYTFKGKNVVSYGGFKNFFSLWFYNGVFIDDTYDVLIAASEGKTKSLRQWRFRSGDEINEQKVLNYIQQAIRIEEKGLQLKPEKFTPVEIPKLLSDELNDNPALYSAFNALTPGKQKEYALYITEAKQESTKQSRMEKIYPMILAGKGLNDKYKGQ